MVTSCDKCSLNKSRTQIVNGRGNPDAPILIIGEAPGEEEDKKGLPFQGRSGKLLDQALAAAGFSEEDYYIINCVRCRPPDNRNPHKEEMTACRDYMLSDIMHPNRKVIITLGRIPLTSLIPNTQKVSMKVIFSTSPLMFNGLRVFPMYHPAYILRAPSNKEEWVMRMTSICNSL